MVATNVMDLQWDMEEVIDLLIRVTTTGIMIGILDTSIILTVASTKATIHAGEVTTTKAI